MITIDSPVLKNFMEPTASDEEIEEFYEMIFNTIDQESVSLLQLIVTMEKYLTSEDDKNRNRSTLLLAKLLESQCKPLSASQIHHFCVFFNSRMADYPSLAPSLRALKGLIIHQWEHFDEKFLDIPDIFNAVFREIEVFLRRISIRFV